MSTHNESSANDVPTRVSFPDTLQVPSAACLPSESATWNTEWSRYFNEWQTDPDADILDLECEAAGELIRPPSTDGQISQQYIASTPQPTGTSHTPLATAAVTSAYPSPTGSFGTQQPTSTLNQVVCQERQPTAAKRSITPPPTPRQTKQHRSLTIPRPQSPPIPQDEISTTTSIPVLLWPVCRLHRDDGSSCSYSPAGAGPARKLSAWKEHIKRQHPWHYIPSKGATVEDVGRMMGLLREQTDEDRSARLVWAREQLVGGKGAPFQRTLWADIVSGRR